MVKEVDLGNELGKSITALKGQYGGMLGEDIWSVLIDKAKM